MVIAAANPSPSTTAARSPLVLLCRRSHRRVHLMGTGPIKVGNPSEVHHSKAGREDHRQNGRPLPLLERLLPQNDPKQRWPDSTTAKVLSGWAPKVTLDGGLAYAMRLIMIQQNGFCLICAQNLQF